MSVATGKREIVIINFWTLTEWWCEKKKKNIHLTTLYENADARYLSLQSEILQVHPEGIKVFVWVYDVESWIYGQLTVVWELWSDSAV